MNENNISSTEKWLYIAVSVLLSIGFWLFVSYSTNPDIEKTFKNVEIKYSFDGKKNYDEEKGLIIMNDYPFATDVTVRGRRNDVIELQKEQIEVSVDLSTSKAGSNTLVTEVRLPRGSLALSDIKHKEIELTMEEYLEKKVKIKIEPLGALPPNTKVHYVLSEEEVTVGGAKSELDKLKSVVAVVNLPDLKDKVSREYKLEILSNEENGIKPNLNLSFEHVTVYSEFKQLKTVPISYSIGKPLPEGYEIASQKLSSSEVTVEGHSSILDGLKSLGAKPLDLSKIDRVGVHNIKLEFLLAEGLTIADEKPAELQISVDSRTVRSVDITNAQVVFEKLKTGYRAEVLNQDLAQLFIEGRTKLLDGINEKKLKLLIDLQDLEEGVHLVSYEIDGMPKDLKVYDNTNVLEVIIQRVGE